MKTAAVEVKSVPDNLLDEVLGPLPEMSERSWVCYGPMAPLGTVQPAYCGEIGEVDAHVLTDRAALAQDCPDCVRVMRARWGL